MCKDGIKLIPSKSLHTVTSYKQWCSVEVLNHDPTAESYKKIAIVTKDVQVGEVLEKFQESFSKSKEHQNVKRIQAEAFQEDIKNTSKCVLQVDYAMAYQCELQNEAMGALWTRGSVNLFTCAVYGNSDTKTLIFGTNYKGKDKFSTGMFVEILYRDYILPNQNILEEIIWSDGPSSEFKYQFMHLFIEKLSTEYKKPFSWKFSATSQRKGVVDGVGGRIKSSVHVHVKVTSLGKKREIVQDAESFCKFASTLCDKTTVIYVGKEEIDNYLSSNPFEYSVPVNGIFKMHIMASDGKNTFL